MVGSDEALWFGERAGNKIGRITLDGTITEYPIPTPDSFSNRIIVGPDWGLWFSQFMGNKIGRITLDGEILSSRCRGLVRPAWRSRLTAASGSPVARAMRSCE